MAWPGGWGYDVADALLRSHRAVVDRPIGSTHPEHDWMVYPLDYGYLEGTSAVDGDGVDVFLGSADRATLTAAAVTFDPYKHDVEVKLFAGCTPDEVRVVAERGVPDVAGTSIRDAVHTLHRAGFRVALGNDAPGPVRGTVPVAGAMLPAGTVVRIERAP